MDTTTGSDNVGATDSTEKQPPCFKRRKCFTGRSSGNGEMHFTVSTFPKEALNVLRVMRRNGTLCDVTIVVGAEEFYAHKVVLAAGSPYFKAMFTSGLIECDMSRVTIQAVCPKIFGALLCFIYASEVTIKENNVCQLLPAATMFQIGHVIEACCQFLEHQLDPCNAIGIANFAQQHGCMELFKKANKFIDQHFSLICQEEEFLQLTSCQLEYLIKRDELNVRSEREVYDAVLKWMVHDEPNRKFKMDDIISAVRCQFLPPIFIKKQINDCDVLKGIPTCRDYLIKIFQDLTLHKPPEVKERTPTAPCAIYVAGGYLRHSLSHVECFLFEEQQWTSLADLPTPRSGLGGAFINGYFYAVGGRNNCPDGNHDSAFVDRYDPLTNAWSKCRPMLTARNRVGVGVVDGLLYAIGGSKGTEHHNSAERYDPDEDKWYPIESMAIKRIGVGVAVVNRILYAVGGYDGRNRLNSMEKYHPEDNSWSQAASMNTCRSGAGVVALNQYIYAVGGYDGSRQLMSVERYDTLTDTWQYVAPMNTPRSALNVAVLVGKLYALGGYEGNDFLSSVEIYDAEKDCWTNAPSMTSGRSGHAAAVCSISCVAHQMFRSNSTESELRDQDLGAYYGPPTQSTDGKP